MKERTRKKRAARIRYEIWKSERLWKDSHLHWAIVAMGEPLWERFGRPDEPIVCPGCYAVAPARCAPGCIDDEMAREREEGGLYGDHDRGPGGADV